MPGNIQVSSTHGAQVVSRQLEYRTSDIAAVSATGFAVAAASATILTQRDLLKPIYAHIYTCIDRGIKCDRRGCLYSDIPMRN